MAFFITSCMGKLSIQVGWTLVNKLWVCCFYFLIRIAKKIGKIYSIPYSKKSLKIILNNNF